MKLTENDLRLLIRGILSEQVEETAEEEVEDSEDTEESGGDDESKIFELITTGNGAMARNLAVTLQLNLNDAFFRKLIDYGVDLLQQSPFALGAHRWRASDAHPGSGPYFVIYCPEPPKNPQLLSPEQRRELEKKESAWSRWKSFSGGVDDFFMNKNKIFSRALGPKSVVSSHGKSRHLCQGGLLFDPTNPRELQHQLNVMEDRWEQIKSADDKLMSESAPNRWQILAGIKE